MKHVSIHRKLIRHLISLGCTISVAEGEMKDSTNLRAILDDIASMGEVDIFVWVPEDDGVRREWALIIPGLDPDETLADFSPGGVIDSWFEIHG